MSVIHNLQVLRIEFIQTLSRGFAVSQFSSSNVFLQWRNQPSRPPSRWCTAAAVGLMAGLQATASWSQVLRDRTMLWGELTSARQLWVSPDYKPFTFSWPQWPQMCLLNKWVDTCLCWGKCIRSVCMQASPWRPVSLVNWWCRSAWLQAVGGIRNTLDFRSSLSFFSLLHRC